MVDYEVHGNVLVMTINRPEAKNAVNGEVAAGIEGGIDRLEDDESLWIGVLAAKGDVFSAGADLKEINSGNAAALMTQRGGFGGIVYRERRKPIIAAVDGLATAGGCEMVLACDLVVASTRASFGLAEVKRNLVAGAGGLFRLPRALPPNVAMEAILTATPIPAERAHQFGMVNRLTEPGRRSTARSPSPPRSPRTPRSRSGRPGGGQGRRRHGRGRAQGPDRPGLRRGPRLRGHQGRADRLHREAQAQLAGPLIR
ncbi:MAG: enoyl-CoA hydratase-related protein [Acidimicrobiales bacterium]